MCEDAPSLPAPGGEKSLAVGIGGRAPDCHGGKLTEELRRKRDNEPAELVAKDVLAPRLGFAHA
ncbi:MAG: hypothetical protein NVSMB9_35290 [Isosphaeraceae bacterium]